MPNLEPGLNDVLALPFVLLFIVIASHESGVGKEAAVLFGEAIVGAVIGFLPATPAALVILASIIAHGLTDTVGARWIERRLEPASTNGSSINGRSTGYSAAGAPSGGGPGAVADGKRNPRGQSDPERPEES